MNTFMNTEETFLLNVINLKPVDNIKDEVNWERVLEILLNHKILPYFYKYHKEIIPKNLKEQFAKIYLKHCEMTKIRIDEAVKISKIINHNNINATILKGVVLSQMVHGDTFSRKSYDIDILIEEDHVSKMHELLEKNSYIHGCGINDPYDISAGLMKLDKPTMKAYKHHEYFEYYFEREKGDYIELELQKSIHGTITDRKMMKQFINSTQNVMINGYDIKTLDNEHTLLHLMESVYTDSEWFYRGPKLNKFLDIFTFISSQKIDWDKLKYLSVNYRMEGIVVYSLNLTNQIFENRIDENIIKKFDFSTAKPFTINWDRDINSRLFTKDSERRNHIIKNLKTICYSDVNKNWNSPIIVENQNKSSEFELIDFKYQFKNRYLIYQDNEMLFFQIKVDKEMLKSTNKFEINIEFFDADQNVPDLIFDELRIYLNEKTFSYKNKSVKHMVFMLSGDNYVVNIPKKDLKLKDKRVAFLIGLEEKILPHFNHALSPNFYFDKEIWKSIPILQL